MRAAAALLCISAAAAAQVQPGDFLVADSVNPSRLIAVRPGSGAVTVIATFGGLGFIHEAMMARDNEQYVVTTDDSNNLPASALLVSTAGAIQTLWSGLPLGSPHGLTVEQKEGYVVGTARPAGVFRAIPFGILQTLYSGAPMLKSRAVATDIDTGDVFSLDGNGEVFRIDATGAITTVAAGLSPPDDCGLASDWRTGDLFASIDARLLRIAPRTGVVTTLASGTPLGYVTGLVLDPDDGTLIVINTANAPGVVPSVYRYSRTGTLLATLATLAGTVRPTGLDLAGSRPLSGLGDAIPGSTYQLELSAPGHGGSPYVMAGSFGVRPGIALPDGRTIPLNLDAFMLLTFLDPVTFSAFQGLLNAAGRSFATVAIPASPALRGLRVYFAWLIPDQAAPSGIRLISNPWGMTVR